MSLEPFCNEIAGYVRSGNTYHQISQILRSRYGDVSGFSAANVRLFCSSLGINHQAGWADNETLQSTVARAINQVGPTFGRRMMQGYLRANGTRASERRVGNVLREVHRSYNRQRVQGLRNTNPIPYVADYFGHKLHIDQNEKLVMFGVTHVIAVDGYSGKVVAFATMPVKNNLKIYDEVYRAAVLQYGMWDQIRVDHGREFYLCLFMQQRNSALRYNCSRTPNLQTASTQNHRVERHWVEINNRVNFPIKTALVELANSDAIDMDDNLNRFCVSTLSMQLCRIGIQREVAAWNQHRIPGRGIPDVLANGNCHTAHVSDTDFPPALVASQMYQLQNHSRLTESSEFAMNPFPAEREQVVCAGQFSQLHPSMEAIYDAVVNGNRNPFKQALADLVAITQALCV